MNGTLGMLGCGNMGSAILRGLIDTATIKPDQACVYDPDAHRREEVSALGIACVDAPAQLARDCDVLILAVKPQMMDEAVKALGTIDPAKTLVVSIAAGISIGHLQSILGDKTRVVRVMPNTPALVRAGAAGIAPSPNCTPEDADRVRVVFESVGIVEQVTEEAMDIVTALSGSGPAYFFYLVECITEAAVHGGLSPDQASRLAGQTLFGAGRLLAESAETAATLRQRVTSKGGTTEAALKTFAALGFAEIVQAGVAAAATRSKELGR